MDDDALMAKLMAAFDDDAALTAGDEPRPSEQPLTRNGSSPGSTRSSTRTPPPRQGRTWSRP